MRGRQPIYALNGGELSPRMEGRQDLDGIYDRAVAKMLNYVATVEGPAMKRPGFRYIKPALASSTWLTPFVFNTTQGYAIEWGEQRLRFFTNGGQILAAGVPYEVETYYTAAEAPRISTHQSFDRLYLAHGVHPPAMLARTAAETFGFARIPLKNGPFKDWNADKLSTVSWSGSGLVGGTATIASSKPIFKPGHVGGPVIFETHDFRDIKAWEAAVRSEEIDIGDKRRSDGKVYSLVDKVDTAGTSDPKFFTGSIEPTHSEGDEWDGSGDQTSANGANNYGGCKWRYEYDRFGVGTITEYTNANTVTIEVTRRLPDLATATYKWALGAFSEAEGWPHLVTVWGQRLIFFKGTEAIGSVVGDFFNFSPITPGGLLAPDMAFRKALGIADPPLWVHADKEFLIAGCARGEVIVGQINRSAGLSSDNLMAQTQSGYGSAEVWPAPIGTAILFIQRGGRKIREATFGYQQERFIGATLNIYARHITRSGVKWMSFQQEPEEMLWGGRDDGVLIAHPHNPEQAIKGFSRVQLAAGGAIAGCSIPSEDGQRDELWTLAELDGEKAILQMADWWDEDLELDEAAKLEQQKTAFFVDWGVSYDGDELDDEGEPLGPKQTFDTGLDHLEGRAVRILADGAVIEGKVVTGGAIALSTPASKVHIGLGYQARLKLLRPELRGQSTVQGLRARIVRLFARLIDSASLRIFDSRGDSDPMFNRPNSLPMGQPAPLFTGDTDNRATGNGSDTNGVTELVSDDPYPSIISQLIPTYDVEELEG